MIARQRDLIHHGHGLIGGSGKQQQHRQAFANRLGDGDGVGLTRHDAFGRNPIRSRPQAFQQATDFLRMAGIWEA